MRIAVLGLGFMGSTHVSALQAVDGLQLTGVWSRDERKLGGDLSAITGNLGTSGQQFDFSGLTKYPDLAAVWADDALDAVDICLPTDQHESAAIAALNAGKHVLVEKPLALDGAGADRVVAAARASGRVLMVAQVLRFLPEYVALREALQAGRLGTVRTAVLRRRCAAPGWSTWLGDAARSGGGVFDLLIHDVDFALDVFGEPASVSAAGHEDLPRGVDVLHATLKYPNGNTVLISGGWHQPRAYPFSMEYTVTGDAATADFRSGADGPALYTESGERVALPLGEQDGFVAELAYFARCCAAGEWPALCPPEQSARAVKLMRLLLSARREQGKEFAWPN